MNTLKPDLQSSLAALNSFARPVFKVKKADIGGPGGGGMSPDAQAVGGPGQDQANQMGQAGPTGTFESNFSNIAHAYIKESSPLLMPYELGFQVLDKNEQETKAIGITAFKLGKEFIYAPAFFLQGQLKGHELLYLKNQDMFVPNKDSWVNYFLNRRPSVLGEPVERNLVNIGVQPPNLYQLSRSPNKFASAVERLSPWAKEALPALAYIATTNPANDNKYKGISDLPSFLKKEGRAVVKTLIASFKDNPKLASVINDLYGLSIVDEAVQEIQKEIKAAMSRSVLKSAAGTKCVNTAGGVRCFNKPEKKLPMKPKSVVDSSNEINTEPGDMMKTSAIGDPIDPGVTYSQQDKLRVFTYDAVMEHGILLEDLDHHDRSKLLKDKVLIQDKRPDPDVNLAYEVESPVRVQNPGETGLYDVLTKSNTFEKCLIIIGPYRNCGREDFATLVKVDGTDGGRAWINIHPSHLWCAHQYTREEFEDWWEKLTEPKSFQKSYSALYVVVGNTGDGSLPFSVHKEISDGDRKVYDVSFKSYAEKGRADHLWMHNPRLMRYRGNYDYFGPNSRIVLTGKRGARLRSHGEELYVPSDYRLLELRPDRDNDDDCMGICSCDAHSEPSPIEPGNQLDIDLLIGRKTASVKIYDTGTEVVINDKRMPKLAALIHLVRDYRLREKQARILLKRASDNTVARFRIKRSDEYYDMQHNYPTTPPIPEQPTGYDVMTGGKIPTQNIGEWNLKIPDMSAHKTDRMIYHPTNNMDPEWNAGIDRQAQNAAMQAAQSGQREIFDTAMIGGLLKTVRDDNMIDRYMGDLTKGLDRLGRILFLFYWHNEKFADRFGKDELIELEESIRNSFEYLGDLILFLRQKDVGHDNLEMQGIDLSETAG